NEGVFRVTEGLLDKYGEDRVRDTPLAESGIVGVSIGLALYGMKPVAEVQFMGFMWPAVDQLNSHASRYRNRSRGQYNVPMVLRTPYGGGVKALEHHSESFESILAHIPGLNVVIPSTPKDAKGLMISSIRDPDPVVFLEPKKLYRAFKQDVPEESFTEEIGKARVVQEGEDITLVAWGAMVPKIVKAADHISEEGISAEVIDLRGVSPYDEEAVHESIRKTGRLLVAQEAPRTMGFASEVIARAVNKEMLSLKAPPMRATGFDVPFPLYKMEDWAIPDVDRIVKKIREAIEW
ncbi:MAG: alpha-ketoacid dehydrogenase subunit beta, partial [Thermoplasmata archaeon]